MGKEKPEAEKKVTVSARITPAESETLERIAADDDRTASNIIARAIREFLERHATKGKRKS